MLECRPQEIIDYSANINPFISNKMIRRIMVKHVDSILHYPDINNAGLINAISNYHSIGTEHVAVGNGAIDLIYRYFAMIRPAKTLIIEPTFNEYKRVLSGLGCEFGSFVTTGDGFEIDFTRLENEIRLGYTDLILCNPNNPTSFYNDKNNILRLTGLCAKHGLRLFIDESFIEFIGGHYSLIDVIGAEPECRIIVLRSLTKYFALPGLRIGYLVSDGDSVAGLNKSAVPWQVNALASAVTVELLESFDRRQFLDAFENERLRFYSKLAGLEQIKVFVPAANFILIKLENETLAGKIADELRKRRILVRQCGDFTGLDNSYLRVAVKTPKLNNKFLRELKRVL